MAVQELKTIEDLQDKLKGKTKKSAFEFRDKSAFSFDMMYQLSCMSVIAAAGVPRKMIFEYAAKLPCSAAAYFKKVDTVCEKLKYDYAKGCRMVGETTKEIKMRELLLRFSSSLLSGEPESEFLIREAKAHAEEYDNEYGRKIEALKLWTDAFVSLVLSAVLVIIMGIVSTMIWEVQSAFLFGLMVISAGTTAIGVWLIHLMTPKESFILRNTGSKEQKLAAAIFKICLPAAMVSMCLIMVVADNLGWAFLAVALFTFPLGYIMHKDDTKITKRDAEIGTFLASLGGIAGAIGTTVKEALGRIDLEAINFLRVEVKRLFVRLQSGINPKLCWSKFVEESGSELVNRSSGMFYDSIDVGGDPDSVGYHASLFANKIALLRAKRKAVAVPFRMLIIVMHTAVTSLLIFVAEVIAIFGNMVAEAQASIPDVSGSVSVGAFTSFNIEGMAMLQSVVMPLVIIFTITNAMAPTLAEGGSWYKVFFHLGITAAISGFCLLLLPEMAAVLFQTVKI
jgi:archaeal flagellar protein FlaJ